MFGFSAVCFWVLLNPFVHIVFGANRILSWDAVLLLVLNFYLLGMRNTIITFRDTMGIFREGRFIPLSGALINVIISILLAPKMGITGVALGTTISIVVTMLWLEPIVLFKHGFKRSPAQYFLKYLLYFVVMVVAAGITQLICALLFGTDYSIGVFVLRLVICMIVPNAIFYVIFSRTKSFRALKGMVMGVLKRRIGRKATA